MGMKNARQSVRFNITLPRDVAKRLKTADNQSALIAQSLRLKFSQQDKAQLEKTLAQGYKRNAQTDSQLAKEYDHTTGDGL